MLVIPWKQYFCRQKKISFPDTLPLLTIKVRVTGVRTLSNALSCCMLPQQKPLAYTKKVSIEVMETWSPQSSQGERVFLYKCTSVTVVGEYWLGCIREGVVLILSCECFVVFGHALLTHTQESGWAVLVALILVGLTFFRICGAYNFS